MTLFPLLLILHLAAAQLNLTVSPHFATIRDTIKAILTIPEDERNRFACLNWEGEFEAGSHCWEHLDQNDFPPRIEYKVKLHTRGVFEFQLSLQRTDKLLRTPLQEIEVN